MYVKNDSNRSCKCVNLNKGFKVYKQKVLKSIRPRPPRSLSLLHGHGRRGGRVDWAGGRRLGGKKARAGYFDRIPHARATPLHRSPRAAMAADSN